MCSQVSNIQLRNEMAFKNTSLKQSKKGLKMLLARMFQFVIRFFFFSSDNQMSLRHRVSKGKCPRGYHSREVELPLWETLTLGVQLTFFFLLQLTIHFTVSKDS